MFVVLCGKAVATISAYKQSIGMKQVKSWKSFKAKER